MSIERLSIAYITKRQKTKTKAKAKDTTETQMLYSFAAFPAGIALFYSLAPLGRGLG